MKKKKGETIQRVQLTGNAALAAGTPLRIQAISAGSGNGWEFGAAVLQESLPLWQGAECFVDHSWTERSVRDLAGICSNPAWKA